MKNKETKNILLTGGTGVFGKYLIQFFLQHENVNLILLVRASSHEAARSRIKEHIKLNERIEIFAADLSEENLGLSDDDYRYIVNKTTHILHAAASTRFNNSLEHARRSNVETTERILSFAKDCLHLIRFGYVSSALIAGKRSGLILEDEFEHNEGFINTYEQSKYEAEALIRKQSETVPTAIFRPPLVISKPHASYTGPVNLLSHSLNLIKKKRLPILPGTTVSVFDMVDSHATAEAIVKLLLKEKLAYLTYHLSNGNKAITVGTILKILEEHLGRKVSIQFCGDMDSFNKKLRWVVLFRPWLRIVYKKTASYLPEIAYPKTFDNQHFLAELQLTHFGPPPEEVFRSILD